MSRLFHVRHGQASFFSDDYDKLSDLGERQARVFNNLSGPAEVEIRAGAIENITSTPPLPLKIVLKANEERVLANLAQTDPTRAASIRVPCHGVAASRSPSGSWWWRCRSRS